MKTSSLYSVTYAQAENALQRLIHLYSMEIENGNINSDFHFLQINEINQSLEKVRQLKVRCAVLSNTAHLSQNDKKAIK